MKKFIEEFKKFALRGNVMDMAVGVIIGGAFTGIVTALTKNFINPLLSLIFTGGPGDISDGVAWTFGAAFASFLTTVVNFFITALVLFMLLGIQLGFWSLLFSHITFCLPFVVVTVYSRLKGFDVRMLEAAKDLGASEFTILRKIILPLAMPAVAAGWVLSFTLSMDDVVVSSFVTGPSYEILPLKIYSMVKVGVSPEVNALATILLVLSLVMVIASQLIARDKTKGNTGDVK